MLVRARRKVDTVEAALEQTPWKNAPQVVLSQLDQSVRQDEPTRAVDLATILADGHPGAKSIQMPNHMEKTASEMRVPLKPAKEMFIEEEPTSLDQNFAKEQNKKRPHTSSPVFPPSDATIETNDPSPLSSSTAAPVSSTKHLALTGLGVLIMLLLAIGIYFIVKPAGLDEPAVVSDENKLPPIPRAQDRPAPKMEEPLVPIVVLGPGGARPAYTFAVHIVTFPNGADVRVDGRLITKTPCILNIAAETDAKITLSKKGYITRTYTWRVNAPLKKGIQLERQIGANP